MERRKKPGLLKYWLTLIIGTVVTTAGITWLALNVGAQGMPDVLEATSAIATPPKTVFDKDVNLIGSTIDIDAGKSIVGKTSKVDVGFTNEGEGVLRLKLIRTSCKCVHGITINGQVAEQDKNWIETPPGQKGVISFSWTPEKEQVRAPNLRISAEFQTNDPQPLFGNGLRLEILTKPSIE